MRRLATLLVAIALAGCANYGWANRSSGARYEAPVYVQTVDVDADSGADAAALTRSLVDALRRGGAGSAEWSAANATPNVACDVAFPSDEMFADNVWVTASARCFVDGLAVSERTAQAQLAFDESDRTLGQHRAFEAASREALQAAANDVVAHLSQD